MPRQSSDLKSSSKAPRARVIKDLRKKRQDVKRSEAMSLKGQTARRPGTSSADAAENLIRSVLEMVPLDSVLNIVADYVREGNRADQMMAALALRGERAKPDIETQSGSALSTEEVGRLLQRSSETVRNHVVRNKLVGYLALNDQTRLCLPAWQFQSGRHPAVHPWVPELLSAFGTNGWALLDFVTAPRDSLDGNYLNLLKAGRVVDVIRAAKRTNPD